MSAPTSQVEAAQPAVVADATAAQATTQENITPEEQIKKETSTENVDAQIKKEEASSNTEMPTSDAAADVKAETTGDVKTEDGDSKPAPLLKTKAQLKKDVSNKKYDASVLPVTDDPKIIRTQVCSPLTHVQGHPLTQSVTVRILLWRQQSSFR